MTLATTKGGIPQRTRLSLRFRVKGRIAFSLCPGEQRVIFWNSLEAEFRPSLTVGLVRGLWLEQSRNHGDSLEGRSENC